MLVWTLPCGECARGARMRTAVAEPPGKPFPALGEARHIAVVPQASPQVPLYGHVAVRARLLDAFGRGVLPASLLLHGPRGIGKQRLALVLARALVCDREDRNASSRPCETCQSCRLSRELSHPDLLWVFPRPRLRDSDPDPADIRHDYAEATAARVRDGLLYAPASGTEAIFAATVRWLVHAAALTPAVARRKVMVIGEAERMVPQEGAEVAANAFLKLLEEPPADTIIVATSSEPGALLPTIRSRLVAVRVSRLANSAVRDFVRDPTVRAALDARGVASGETERVRRAAGAPGALLDERAMGAAADAARALLDAALGRSRAAKYKVALQQGGARARGSFSDTLEGLVTLLHERAVEAVRARDERAAEAVSAAVDLAERAKTQADGNVSPQLITGGAPPLDRDTRGARERGVRRRRWAMTRLTHLGPSGEARMVDVSGKADTVRVARATGAIRMRIDTLRAILANTVAKGDVMAVARLAGIMAAKRTSELIPLCHPVVLTDAQVEITPDDTLPGLRVEAVMRTVGKTGVEMEAITAATVSLITVYDMAKAVDRSMMIMEIVLEEKAGGQSGQWVRR